MQGTEASVASEQTTFRMALRLVRRAFTAVVLCCPAFGDEKLLHSHTVFSGVSKKEMNRYHFKHLRMW